MRVEEDEDEKEEEEEEQFNEKKEEQKKKRKKKKYRWKKLRRGLEENKKTIKVEEIESVDEEWQEREGHADGKWNNAVEVRGL